MIDPGYVRPDYDWDEEYGAHLLEFTDLMWIFSEFDQEGRRWISIDGRFGRYEDN